jgi:integrase
VTADDVDKWLADKAQLLSTRTLQEVRSVLKRAVTRAQARDKVKRNVVLLCEVPQGRTVRPSKSLTLTQAEALLAAAENTSLHAHIVLSLLTGARTEELRALTWSYVDLDSDPPFIMVWRSVRASGGRMEALMATAPRQMLMTVCGSDPGYQLGKSHPRSAAYVLRR